MHRWPESALISWFVDDGVVHPAAARVSLLRKQMLPAREAAWVIGDNVQPGREFDYMQNCYSVQLRTMCIFSDADVMVQTGCAG